MIEGRIENEAVRTAGNTKDLRTANCVAIRNIIASEGPLSRKQLAERTGLTAAAVTGITARLIQRGVLYEAGPGVPSGGRPSILLDIAPKVATSLAASIQKGAISSALFGIHGDILARRFSSLDTSSPEDAVEAISRQAEDMLTEAGMACNNLSIASVATAGLVNPYTGVIERSTNLGWHDEPIAKKLEAALGIPILVENISNAAALAEMAQGAGRGAKSLVYLSISAGIGAGVILAGHIYSGSHGYAGEVGHTPAVLSGGALCSCGRRGCLEAEYSARAISVKLGHKDLEGLMDGPLSNDPTVRKVMDEASEAIGRTVAVLMSLYDPEVVILGGELASVGGTFLEDVARSARSHCLGEIADKLEIRGSGILKDTPMVGARLIALRNLLNTQEWKKD